MSLASVILADSPVFYWPLDEASGTTAGDDSGNGNDGTYLGSPALGQHGPEICTDAASKAVLLDGYGYGTLSSSGTAQYVRRATSPLSGTGDLTLEASFWPAADAFATTGRIYTLFQQRPSPRSATGFIRVSFRYVSGDPKLQLHLESVGATLSVDGTDFASDPECWKHVALTRSGNTWRLYLQGTERGSHTQAVTVTSQNLTFGGDHPDINPILEYVEQELWRGRLAHAAGYSAALTAADIAERAAALCPCGGGAGIDWLIGVAGGSLSGGDPEPPDLTNGETIGYTGDYVERVVPAGVTTITVDAYGAEGGGEYAGTTVPGKGGRVKCDVAVTPGETLRFYTGGQGNLGAQAEIAGGSRTPPGWNAGLASDFVSGGRSAVGGRAAGGGGGATEVRRAPYGLADRLVVAPGGGGCGANSASTSFSGGGNGGTPSGTAGQNGISGPTGGGGGTSGAGGAGGTGSSAGTAGGLGYGGDGGNNSNPRGGGGGGGGRFGGGGGGSSGTATAGGGGGGGSGLSTGVNETLQTGVRSGHGTLTVTW